MFKKLLHPKESQDPTLRQQSLWGYALGRLGAKAIVVIGIILSALCATWLGNLIQNLVWCIFDLFPFGKMANTFLTKTFTWEAMFHNEYMLGKIPFSFFMAHGNLIASCMRGIGFLAGTIVSCWLAWKVWVRYRNINHHEQGDDRFAYPYEIADETNRIPDRAYRYDKPSGVIMMHKMNWKGSINRVVKQQLFDLVQYFQLDKDHDPTQHEFNHFYATVKAVVIFLLVLLGMLSIHGFYNYNFGGNGGHVGASPFWLFLVAWWIFHFVVKGFFDIFIDLVKLQISVFTATLPMMLLVLFFEAIGIMYVAYHFGGSIVHSFEYGGDARAYLTKFKKFFTTRDKKDTAEGMTASASIHNNHADSRIGVLFDEIKNPQNHLPTIKDVLQKENCKYNDKIPSTNTKYWRWEAIHSYFYPFIHGNHPFFKRPGRALKMAGLQFLSNILALDSGITGWYYITNGNGALQNVLLYGITRSGKGQMIVNTIVDVNSRAAPRYQKNMIFNDSKGELAASTSQILKKRGYNVNVLNIMDPTHSMSYNPLAEVITETKQGDIGQASKSCSILAYTIYHEKNAGSNKFFYDEAASLFDSIVFALMAFAHSRYYGLDSYTPKMVKYKGSMYSVHDDGLANSHPLYTDIDHKNRNPKVFIRHHQKYYANKVNGKTVVHSTINAWERVTIHNTVSLMTQLGGETAKEQGSSDMDSSNRMVIYFEHLTHHVNKLKNKDNLSEIAEDQLNIMKQAISEFEQSKISGGGKTAGSIYTTFLNNLKIYQQPPIAKMTSKNSYHAEEMGFDRLLTVQFSRRFGLQAFKATLYRGMKGTYTDINGKKVTGYIPDTRKNSDGHPIGINETVNSKLTGKGVAQVPFEKPIKVNHFFVKFHIFDERASKYFDFLFECQKNFYTPKVYEDISSNFRERPSVADLEMVVGQGRHTYHVIKKGHDYLLDKNSNKPKIKKTHYVPLSTTKYQESDLRVINKYTNKIQLHGVSVVPRYYPLKEDYMNVGTSSPVSELQDEPPKKAIRATHFLYNPHPTALFLVTPPNASELNQLCTFLINQTFNTLSTLGLSITKGRHIQRPLQFILDELGNIPPIPDMPKKLSIGLSQHIDFILVFQNKEQITTNYGQTGGQSIIANCSTTYYILSHSEQTVDAISKACGKRTIISGGSNVDPTKAVGTNNNLSKQAQPVITPTELRHLEPGEIIILRTNDRSSTSGKNTVPWPIFDKGKYVLPYSFWFLKKFESSESLNEVPVVTPHKYLDLNKDTTDFTGIYEWMEKTDPIDATFASKKASDVMNEVKSSGLGHQFQVIFSNELVDKQNQKDTQGILKVAHHIEKAIPFYKSLQFSKDLAHLSLFTVSAITDASKKGEDHRKMIPGLASGNKQTCTQIFNFLSDEKFTALNYCKDARSKIEAVTKGNSVKEHALAQEIPFLYYKSQIGQVLGYCQGDIQNSDVKTTNVVIEKPSDYELANESWILNEVNCLFMNFLVRMGLIKATDIHQYQLTENGKFLMNKEDCRNAIKVFLANNHFQYTPSISWDALLSKGFNTIIWVHENAVQNLKKVKADFKKAKSEHPNLDYSDYKIEHIHNYTQYYGLAFALGICNLDLYQKFNTYTDSTGNNKYSFGAVPLVYLGMVLPIYDAFIRTPADQIRPNDLRASKPAVDLMAQLQRLDIVAKNFYSKIQREQEQ